MAQYRTYSTLNKSTEDESEHISVPQIRSAEHRSEVINTHQVVVIDNYTDWCGPCKHCAPRFAKLAGKYTKPGVCALVKENVEDGFDGHPEKIRGVPCFHFYANGQYISESTVVGADTDAVEQNLTQLLGIDSSRRY